MPIDSPAVVYCRISQDRTGEGVGVERQRSDCFKLADSLGWSVVETYVDNDVSAYSGKPRPEYRRMLDKLKTGNVGAVLAWHTDRLYRSIPDLSELIEICDDRGIEIRTCRAGEVDLSTPSGRLSATMFASISRYEVERSAERIRSAKEAQAREGKYRGGVRPIGYEVGGMVLNETEAARIRKAADDLLAGASLMSTARAWNAEGFTTSQGNRWTATSVRRVLTRARNAGLVESDGKIVGPAQWPAIYDADTLNAIRTIVSDPSRRSYVSFARRNQGAGVYRCGRCDAPMRVQHGVKRERYYQCSRSYHLSQMQAPLDVFVSALVLERLSRQDAISVFTSDDDVDLSDVRRRRAELQARKDELAALFATGSIDGSQLRLGSARIQSDIDRLDKQLAVARESSPFAGMIMAEDIASQWDSLTADIRGKIIDALMVVTVLPLGPGRARRKDFHVSERVKVEWKQ